MKISNYVEPSSWSNITLDVRLVMNIRPAGTYTPTEPDKKEPEKDDEEIIVIHHTKDDGIDWHHLYDEINKYNKHHEEFPYHHHRHDHRNCDYDFDDREYHKHKQHDLPRHEYPNDEVDEEVII